MEVKKRVHRTYAEDQASLKRNLPKRREKFEKEVWKYRDICPDEDMRYRFIQYWTEPNHTKTKMRFELEKTWDTESRLDRWMYTDE